MPAAAANVSLVSVALDLAVVRVIAVDVFNVMRLDAGAFGEFLQGRVLLGFVVVIQVKRPVGPEDVLVGCRNVGDGGHRGRGSSASPSAGSAGREETGKSQAAGTSQKLSTRKVQALRLQYQRADFWVPGQFTTDLVGHCWFPFS